MIDKTTIHRGGNENQQEPGSNTLGQNRPLLSGFNKHISIFFENASFALKTKACH